jgi:hypothetical protein
MLIMRRQSIFHHEFSGGKWEILVNRDVILLPQDLLPYPTKLKHLRIHEKSMFLYLIFGTNSHAFRLLKQVLKHRGSDYCLGGQLSPGPKQL